MQGQLGNHLLLPSLCGAADSSTKAIVIYLTHRIEDCEDMCPSVTCFVFSNWTFPYTQLRVVGFGCSSCLRTMAISMQTCGDIQDALFLNRFTHTQNVINEQFSRRCLSCRRLTSSLLMLWPYSALQLSPHVLAQRGCRIRPTFKTCIAPTLHVLNIS